MDEKALRDRIADMLLGKESLDRFEDWFVQNSWNVHKYGDYDLQKLVFAIELRLAEYSSGHLSERELRENLRSLLGAVTVNIGTQPSALDIKGGSSTQFNLRQAVFGAPVFVGISLEEAYG